MTSAAVSSPSEAGPQSATLTHMSESVGIRALQQHASAVVARAAAGEEIVITDRGRPVARIVPLRPRGLQALIDEGLVTPARRPFSELGPPLPAGDGPTLSEILAEMREADRER
jgi:prevent-host-death family protein